MTNLLRRVFERVLGSIGVVLGAVTVIFLVLNWLPGDLATLVAGSDASAETIEHVRAKLGVDQSLGHRYCKYMVGLAHGDLGRSYMTEEPVAERLRAQLPATLQLTLAASLLAVGLGVGLGVLCALHRGSWLDQAIQAGSSLLVSMPSFWLGILLILLFSVRLRWLPVLGDGGVRATVLPVFCLGLVVSVPLLRLVRDSMLDGLHEPYVTTLRAKGLGERRIFFVHVLRNALTGAVTLLGVLMGELLSGAVIVETLFARQGLGRTAVEAISHKDMPLVQGAILVLSLGYVFVNLLVDMSYALIDPRTRLSSAKGLR
jgi:ABC-type dipeptide/oligopeptide/nickel transport system permease component